VEFVRVACAQREHVLMELAYREHVSFAVNPVSAPTPVLEPNTQGWPRKGPPTFNAY
jgi:hypothetical protein